MLPSSGYSGPEAETRNRDFFGNEALSASETIAELWDGRLRGEDIVLVCAAGGRMVCS